MFSNHSLGGGFTLFITPIAFVGFSLLWHPWSKKIVRNLRILDFKNVLNEFKVFFRLSKFIHNHWRLHLHFHFNNRYKIHK